MTYLPLLFFGLAPSIIWLLFFLRKDIHPEPKRMVIFVFLLGMVIAPAAAFFECLPIGFDKTGNLKCLSPLIFSEILPYPFNLFFYFLLGVALIEEVAKYLVVRIKILRSVELDEPLDIMLYMIISALGFAALENILIFLSPEILFLPLGKTLVLTSFRFISATFLHSLCSGLVGYFLALSFFEIKSRVKLIAAGLGAAIVLHGAYNFSIMTTKGRLNFVIPIIILIGLALAISLGFKRLRKMASVCKLK